MKTIVVALILIIFISGCATHMKDIDTNEQMFNKNCSFILGVNRYADVVNNHCDYVCNKEGMNSAGWKCSDNETVVCTCSK
jgi:hypothetical protein